MAESYDGLRRIGEAYERYIVERLQREGVPIARTETKALQFRLGDTTLGIEIKFDRRHAVTGNFYLEVAEKTSPDKIIFTPSGIYHQPLVPWFSLGDYRDWYCFKTTALVAVVTAGSFRRVDSPTSQGFVVPLHHLQPLIVRERHWDDREPDGSWTWPSSPEAEAKMRDLGTAIFGIRYDEHGRAK